mmetsp:Transcript_48859/g.140255  ORF Transcript_48859/g.140255 Transcript_48859/m.140255 type:complete len:272 (+) Transcript_48859:87-902(+)
MKQSEGLHWLAAVTPVLPCQQPLPPPLPSMELVPSSLLLAWRSRGGRRAGPRQGLAREWRKATVHGPGAAAALAAERARAPGGRAVQLRGAAPLLQHADLRPDAARPRRLGGVVAAGHQAAAEEQAALLRGPAGPDGGRGRELRAHCRRGCRVRDGRLPRRGRGKSLPDILLGDAVREPELKQLGAEPECDGLLGHGALLGDRRGRREPLLVRAAVGALQGSSQAVQFLLGGLSLRVCGVQRVALLGKHGGDFGQLLLGHGQSGLARVVVA